MSSEREKLIEIWLDSAGERQYQFAFRNALLGSGFTVLHDTSHTALELGKDILALSPSGELFAYQLKGNPGGRLTISQWQDLVAQINTLVYQPVSHPSIKLGTRHTPVLVTNGEIHEDVYAAIASFNSAIVGPLARPLQTISRGQLLRRIIDASATLWPVDIQSQRNILNLYASEGDDELPLEAFVSILRDGFAAEKYAQSAIPAMHLVTAVLSARWIEKANYFELIKMYCLLAVAAICFQARWSKRTARDDRYIELILADLRSLHRQFIHVVSSQFHSRPLLNKDIFSEFPYFHPRKQMISGILAAACLDKSIELDDATSDFVWSFICKQKRSGFLLWEGIVPFCLAEFWASSNIQGTNRPILWLFSIVRDLLRCNDSDSEENHLPGPYYSLAQVVIAKYRWVLGVQRSELDGDSHYRRSWFAEALFLLVARRNYKLLCQLIWPLLTKFVHPRTRLRNAHDFGPANCVNAIAEERLIDTTVAKSWDQVIDDASATYRPLMPDRLFEHPELVLMYCMFVPQRMDRDVILWLDRQFCRTWH